MRRIGRLFLAALVATLILLPAVPSQATMCRGPGEPTDPPTGLGNIIGETCDELCNRGIVCLVP